MASEGIMMAAVEKGGDRQSLHERIRQHSQAAALVVKQHGGENDLLERLKKDDAFTGVDFNEALKPEKFVGRAPQQVDEFLRETVEPIRKRYANALTHDAHVSV